MGPGMRATTGSAVGAAFGLLAACLSFDPFACADDTQCDREVGGICTIGFCSYPDAACPSGLRFEDSAGMGLGGECVALGGTGGATETDSDEGTDTGDETGGSSTTVGDEVADDLTDDDESGTDESTDTGAPTCGGAGEACCDGDACDAGLACLGEGCSCVASIAVGNRHTCAVKRDGTVVCWGSNSVAQLGQPLITESLVPVEVPGPFGAGMAATVVAARNHTCALRDDDFAYCWGDNALGQVDPASGLASISNPTIAAFSGAVAVGTGASHTCVARNTGTTTTCWGDNSSGQLTGATAGPTPVDNVAGFTWSSIAVGSAFTCGLQAVGTVHCWGANESGQLAADPVATPTSDAPLLVGLAPAAGLVAGGQHVCAIVGMGVRCWGRGDLGQLGDGLGTDSFAPVDVGLPPGSAAMGLAAGPNHSCARMATGEVYCWGSNANGQLMLEPDKLGNDMFTLTPVLVEVGASAVQVATGTTHTCVLSTGGEILCWGTNTEGQIGDGTTDYGFVPTPTMLQCP